MVDSYSDPYRFLHFYEVPVARGLAVLWKGSSEVRLRERASHDPEVSQLVVPLSILVASFFDTHGIVRAAARSVLAAREKNLREGYASMLQSE